MHIITYPHPTLRYPSKTVRRVDEPLRALVGDMFQLMYQANGVGLAANQVDLPLRFFIVNLAGKPDEGEELVFINPVVSRPRGNAEEEEGCLSIPGVYGMVRRPKQVRINAFDLSGQETQTDVDGLLARVIQHETDHLDGILFTDRMTEMGRLTIGLELEEFELEFRSKRETGELPDDLVIQTRLIEWEAKYG